MSGMLVNAYALADSVPKTFTPLQTIFRTVNVNPVADDGTGRTNAINDGSLISTWGKTATGYTHIRIGTADTMRITSEGAYNFYGYFVDTYGNKLAATLYPATSPITQFTLGTYV